MPMVSSSSIGSFPRAVVVVGAWVLGVCFQAHAGDVVLEDPAGYVWDLDADAYGHVIDGTDNAYDLWPDLCLPGGAAGGTCSTEEIYRVSSEAGLEVDGRQVVMSSLTIGNLSVRRKIFVPAQGAAFARYLEILYNPALRPVSVDVRLGTVDAAGGRLGAGDSTVVTATFDKDTDLEPGDDWWCTDDALDGGGAPAIAHVVRGSGGRVTVGAVQVGAFDGGPGSIYWEYQNVTIPARSTVILLHFEVQASTRAEAEEMARALHDGPVDMLEGMTSEEVDAVVNWDLEFVPTADAGGPYSGDEGVALALDGSASSDPNGDIVLYEWDCTNDGTVDVSDASPTGSSCVYPDEGSYTLRLVVTDATGFSATDTTPVTIANVAPSIDALNLPQAVSRGTR